MKMTNPPHPSALVLRKGNCASFWASYPSQANSRANIKRHGNHISVKWSSNMTFLLEHGVKHVGQEMHFLGNGSSLRGNSSASSAGQASPSGAPREGR